MNKDDSSSYSNANLTSKMTERFNNDVNEKNNKCNLKNCKIITIGKCSRYYLYILYKGLFELFSLLLLGTKNFNDNGIGIFGFCPTLSKFNFVKSIFLYIGYIIFGFIFFKYRRVDKEDTNDLLYKKEKEQEQVNQKHQFIHNKPKIKLTKKTFIAIVLVSLAFVTHIEVKKVFYIEGLQFFNFWSLEIFFMLYFMKKYFIVYFYRHHKVAIIFNSTVCSAFLLMASFLPTSLSEKNEGNSYHTINQKLGSFFYCFLFIFIFLVLSNIYCYSRVCAKVLMQINFLSPYQIIFFFGIIGFIVSLISSIIAYFVSFF